MVKKLTLIGILIAGIWPLTSIAQGKTSQNNLVEAGAIIPVGALAESHRIGASVDYTFRVNHFGNSRRKKSLIGLSLTGGGNYLFGRTVITAGHEFKFENVIDVHALAGIIYRIAPLLDATLAAGPAGLITKNEFRMGWTGQTGLTYKITERFTLGPQIQFRYQKSVEDWWAFRLKAGMMF